MRKKFWVDASETGVQQARLNAKLNHMEDRVQFLCEDVFELLPELERKGETFDVIVLDPPAFTKSRNSVKNATKGYREINLRAMKLVKDGGYLATCSCSHFMTYELFYQRPSIRRLTTCTKRLRQVEFQNPGTGSSDSLGGGRILLSEILHFPGL